MNPTEYVRCEGCGELHPQLECETIIVKITKGKNCALKPIMARPVPVAERFVERTVTTGIAEDVPAANDRIPVPQDQPKAMPKKNIVPAHLLGMMIPPGAPGFETHGAKETRRV